MVLEVRDLADQGAEDSDMTKKSKFKKRVRTQMEETGDRYTDAAEAIKGAEADKKVPVAMLDLIAAREDGALAVSEVLRKFHEEHHARGEWRATFGSHAIEHLWPGDGQPPKTEKLRKLLTDYQTDQTIGTSGVRQRSERHQKTVQQEYARMAKAVADKWPRIPAIDPGPMTEEDKRFYDASVPGVVLTKQDLGGHTESEVLMHLWEYAPDVNAKFGMPAVPKTYRGNPEVKQGRGRAFEPLRTSLVGGSGVLPEGTPRVALPSRNPHPTESSYYEFAKEGEPVPVIDGKDHEAVELGKQLGNTEKHVQVAEELKGKEEQLKEMRQSGVHREGYVSSQEFLKASAPEPVEDLDRMYLAQHPEDQSEIERLRKKLEAAGIDPDA